MNLSPEINNEYISIKSEILSNKRDTDDLLLQAVNAFDEGNYTLASQITLTIIKDKAHDPEAIKLYLLSIKISENAKLISLHDFSEKYPGRVAFHPVPDMTTHTVPHFHGQPYGIYSVNEMCVVGAHGIFTTVHDEILKEQNTCYEDISKELRIVIKNPEKEFIEVKELLSLVSGYTYCFYHWILDSMPKVFMAELSNYTGYYLIPLGNPFAHQMLTQVGIPSDRIIETKYNAIFAERLLIPTHFDSMAFASNPEFHFQFRQWMLSNFCKHTERTKHIGERIFIARKNGGKRSISNQDEINPLLEHYGFTVVYMEDYSFEEQVAIAHNAKVIAGPHGAGFTHTLFLKPHSLVIECFPKDYINYCSIWPVKLLGHRYFSIVSYMQLQDEQVHVDLAYLSHILSTELEMSLKLR